MLKMKVLGMEPPWFIELLKSNFRYRFTLAGASRIPSVRSRDLGAIENTIKRIHNNVDMT